jgi:hypothetical protein
MLSRQDAFLKNISGSPTAESWIAHTTAGRDHLRARWKEWTFPSGSGCNCFSRRRVLRRNGEPLKLWRKSSIEGEDQ